MRKSLKAATVAGVAIACLSAGIVSAEATVSRVATCSNKVVQVSPNQTTCWSGRGDAYPTLYSVWGNGGGIYSGYTGGYSGRYGYQEFFSKSSQRSIPGETVSQVHIY
jgi:hypothetical protein